MMFSIKKSIFIVFVFLVFVILLNVGEVNASSIDVIWPNEDECLKAGKAYIPGGIQWINPLSATYHHFAIYETGDTDVPPTSGGWIAHQVYKILIGTDSATGEEVTGGVYGSWSIPNTPGAKVKIWVEAHDTSHNRLDIASSDAVTISSSCDTGEEETTGGDVHILPVAPTNLTASATSSGVSLSWGIPELPTSGEVVGILFYTTGFKIYRNNILVALATAPFYIDKDVTLGVDYAYHVVAYDQSGNLSEKSKTVAVKTATSIGAEPATPVTTVTGPVVIPALPTNPTAAQIQEVISAMLKQVAYLQSQLKQTGVTVKTLAQTMSVGMQGENVKTLQEFLKSRGTDVYPEGLVTGYFGELTKKAVIRFQEKYAKNVLKPNSLVNGTGFVGLSTLNKINELILFKN